MFSQEFRELLEYRLTNALAESTDPELQRYWCDGVLDPEWADEYEPSYVARTQRVILRAWMEGVRTKTAPKTHQLHPLHLALGPASLQAYVKGQDLRHWIERGIDPAAVVVEATGKSFAFVLHLP
jgi:hypothetical protein